MARSPFTLAAAVTAALPGAEVTGARSLTAGGDGRFDSAVATLADGREVVIRVADDDDAARELAAEALALRALTAGARAILPFDAPEYLGETRVGEGRALVTGLLSGFQIDAAFVPAGRGAATSMGTAIAAVHALPASVVRGAGLVSRSASELRDEIGSLVDQAAATGRVPARLTVRWREAVADDELWRFESTVVLGGVHARSFLFVDDAERGPEVTGIVGWHGLAVGDPATDLAWLSTTPDAATDVQESYAAASDRVPDAALIIRARLGAELDFARWLVHGDEMRRADIVDDAAALLDSLAEGLRGDDLAVIASRRDGVDSALDALDRVPKTAGDGIDTSMQTDAYNPSDLWADTAASHVAGMESTGIDRSAAAESHEPVDAARGDDHATDAFDADEFRTVIAKAHGSFAGPEEERADVSADSERADISADSARADAIIAARRAEMLDMETEDLTDIAQSELFAEQERDYLSSRTPVSAPVSGGRGSGGPGSGDTGSGGPGSNGEGSEAAPEHSNDAATDSEDEAQRAARAALQRWRSSSSE